MFRGFRGWFFLKDSQGGVVGNVPEMQSRRTVIKRALKAGAYAAPAVLAVSQISLAAAVTPPPSMIGGTMSVGFSFLSDAGSGLGNYLVRGMGFASNTPFFLVIAPFNSNGDADLFDQRAVFTDQGGSFSYQARFSLGISAQPIAALVNGGTIFLTAVPGFISVPTATTTALTVTPNAPATQVAATTSAAATQVAVTATAIAGTIPTKPPMPATIVVSTPNQIATAQAAATQAAQTAAASAATVAVTAPVGPQPPSHP